MQEAPTARSASDCPRFATAPCCVTFGEWFVFSVLWLWRRGWGWGGSTQGPFLTGQGDCHTARRKHLAPSLTHGGLPVFRARGATPSGALCPPRGDQAGPPSAGRTAPISQMWKQKLGGETTPGIPQQDPQGRPPSPGALPTPPEAGPETSWENRLEEAEAAAPLTLSGGGSCVSPLAVCSGLVAAVGTGAGQAGGKGEGRGLASATPGPVAQLAGTARKVRNVPAALPGTAGGDTAGR